VGLQSFERGLERMVEGVFTRAFRSQLRPIELGRRLVREMDDHRSVDVKGRTVVPNAFTFHLSPQDFENFAEIREALVRELADAAREYARDEGYGFMGPVQVELEVDEHLRPGRFAVDSRLHEGRGGMGAGTLVLPSGDRLNLGERPVVIGRLPECEITLSDPNVSRRHAEVHPAGTGFAVTDLGSTNGTKVNGVGVPGEQLLREGDVISVGATRIRFEAS
jgi:hypothetical protein